MRKIATLLCGIALGFVLPHFVNSCPAGRRFFDRVNQATQEVIDAVVEGYNEG